MNDYTLEQLRQELIDALHCHQGASDRWNLFRATGLSDAALLRAVGEEFGIEGGFFCKGRPGHYRAGGRSPRFWVGSKFNHTNPTLQGEALVQWARSVLAMPLTADEPQAAQLGLF